MYWNSFALLFLTIISINIHVSELSHRPKLLSPHWKYCPVDEKWDIWNKKCVSRLKPRYLVPFNITYWNRRRSYPTASDNPSSKLRISRLKL
ncbi:uncharacterized protein LOC113237589 isoform X2 [Hyposmocoma kahamanoa]|uniref:uncharacterized protein LOC113237589 isoform X2 n=1 Tax=Hyposmocoma kahamanoa TaxID=1477025 RepID=UPI000E6D987D|nr:uncharacterized protein LOC113237589 isoform X2 [Hyposmocoma kahamanoa]